MRALQPDFLTVPTKAPNKPNPRTVLADAEAALRRLTKKEQPKTPRQIVLEAEARLAVLAPAEHKPVGFWEVADSAAVGRYIRKPENVRERERQQTREESRRLSAEVVDLVRRVEAAKSRRRGPTYIAKMEEQNANWNG